MFPVRQQSPAVACTVFTQGGQDEPVRRFRASRRREVCDRFELGTRGSASMPAPESGRRGNPASSPPGPVKDARCSESCTGVGLAGRPAFPHRHTPPSPTRERGTSGELACSRRGDRLTSAQSLAYKQPVIVDPHFTYEIRSQAQQGCSFLQTQVLSSPDGKR